MNSSESKLPCSPKSQDKHMHIAFSTNNNYAPHTGAAIASLLSNTLSKRQMNIHILYMEMSDENTRNLKLLCKLHAGTCINFLKINIDDFRSFPVHIGVLALETYFRLKLPKVLPEVEKVIYLDSDIIAIGDIEKLWCREMKESLILGVEVPIYLHKEYLEKLGMKKTSPYFNGGVVVMNLSKMRSSGFYQKMMPFVEEKYRILRYQDQDILNALSEGQWHPLPLAYNAFWCVLDSPKKNKFTYYTDEDLKQARTNPFIIHFNMNPRPWEAGCIDPRRKLYWKYQDLTPFHFPPPEPKENLTKFLVNKMHYYRLNYLPRTGIVSILLALIKLFKTKKTK